MKFTTAGESHGKAIVGIIEGLPANVNIDINFIKPIAAWRRYS